MRYALIASELAPVECLRTSQEGQVSVACPVLEQRGCVWSHGIAGTLSCAAQDECISRKKFFNMMEDMKGKIRVYARVRPMLSFEQDRGHKNALNIPDELTLDHIWKDKKREYNFDAVFAPDASQDKVRSYLCC